MCFAERYSRLVFFLLNLALIGCGLAAAALGVYCLHKTLDYNRAAGMIYMVVVFGAVIAVAVGFVIVGCLGVGSALIEGKGTLYLYSATLGLFIALQATLLILVVLFKADGTRIILPSMLRSQNQYFAVPVDSPRQVPTGNMEVKHGWDEMQQGLGCCGSTDPSSWGTTRLFHPAAKPASCSREWKGKAEDRPFVLGNYYLHGCADLMVKHINRQIVTVGAVGGCMVLFQLLLLALGLSLEKPLAEMLVTIQKAASFQRKAPRQPRYTGSAEQLDHTKI